MLTILRKVRGRKYRVRCDCGRELSVPRAYLNRVKPKEHCGCQYRSTKREYAIWYMMIVRCTDPRHRSYYRYGGRGIKVCDEWLNSFEAFYACVGAAPSKNYSLDRINNDGNYEPGNVRWATAKQQANNKSKSC